MKLKCKCCDDCVPRGCSCVEGQLDEKERLVPCCEWFYEKEGWDENELQIL